MRTWLRWAILVTMAVLLAPTGPARAAFGECVSADYRAAFDERLRAVDYDCIERMRVPVSTPSGERHIRIIYDRSADWIAAAATMAAFERGARLGAEAIGRLGGVELEDVTILLADDFPPREGSRFSTIAGNTDFAFDSECHVVFYLAGPASDPELAASITAHEIFHCVQVANLTTAQMTSGAAGTGAGGDWWMEGSADWFSALAVPDPALMPQDVEAFDSMSPTTPLNHLAYSASIFFLWLAAEDGPNAVVPFLRTMAGSHDEAEQRAAMAGFAQARWLAFAQAYLDGDIRYPDGRALGSSPQTGDAWDWSATRTQTLALEPFVLARGAATFACGHWRTSVRPAAMHSARAGDGGAWAGLPEEIDTSSGSGGNYRVAAFNASGAPVTLNIIGTMESGCGDCAGSRELDACVVGSWQLTSGGAAEWMRNQGIPGNFSTSGEAVTFRADGSYFTGLVHGTAEVRGRDGSSGSGFMQAQAGGRWSTAGGTLNLCADSQALAGGGTIRSRNGGGAAITMPTAPPVNSRERYTCSGANLDTERDIPRSPPMPFHYTRTSGD